MRKPNRTDFNQVQSWPSAYMWEGVKKGIRTVRETTNAAFALVSTLIFLPLNRAISEDSPPTANFALTSAGWSTTLVRSISEDSNANATFALKSVLAALPFTDAIADTGNATFALGSVLVAAPVNRTINDTCNAGFALTVAP